MEKSLTGFPVRLLTLAAMSEEEWLRQCPPESIPGADVARARRKGNQARQLLDSPQCCPDRASALVQGMVKDFERGKHD